MVLVRLGVKGADLALAERIVQGGVDGIGGDVHARCGGAVDGELGGHAIGLIVGGHVAQLRQLAHGVNQLAGPE